MNIPSASPSSAALSPEAPSLRDRIRAVTARLVKLSSQVQDVLRSGAPQQEKDARIKPLQAQIDALQARLAALIRQQAEAASRRQADIDRGQTPQPSFSAMKAGQPTPPAGVLAVA